jgi:hypothetical protein
VNPIDGRGLGNAVVVGDRLTQRGLLPREPSSTDEIQGSVDPVRPPVDLWTAATSLGRIYRQLEGLSRRLGTEKLGPWAIPEWPSRLVGGDRELNFQLSSAVESVLGTDSDSAALVRKYDARYMRVIPVLQHAAVEWCTRTLELEASLLEALRRETAQPAFSAWMHKTAEEIVRMSVGCRVDAAARYRSELVRMGYTGTASSASAKSSDLTGLPPQALDIGRGSCLFEALKASLASKKWDYVPQPPTDPNQLKRYIEMVEVIAAARRMTYRRPSLEDTIEAYERSGTEGTRLVQEIISPAAGAVNQFLATIRSNPTLIWHFPGLILSGVRELGLQDIDGFREYALGIGVVRSNRTGLVLQQLGIGLLVVGLVATGLGAPVGVSLGLGALDLGTAGANVYFSYVRDREQELGGHASLFLPDEKAFASEAGYDSTGLAVAFALLAALTLSATLLKAWRPRTPPPRGGRPRGAADPPSSASTQPQRARLPERKRSFADPERSGPQPRRGAEEIRAAAGGDTPGAPAPKGPKSNSQGIASKGTSPKASTGGDVGGTGVGSPKIPPVPPVAPQWVLDFVANLRRRFPGLAKANLRPIRRELSGSGLYEEAMRTGGARWSFEADFNGKKIQLDDITPEGEITDIKLRDTGRTIGREREWRPPERSESIPSDVYDIVTRKPPAKPSRFKDIEFIREKFGPQLAEQVGFADQTGLNGVVWETDQEWMYITLKKIIRDYNFVDRFPRMSVRAVLRP